MHSSSPGCWPTPSRCSGCRRAIGTASAVNCLVIVVLQMAVVKWTAKRAAPSLLVAVGSIWVLSWLLAAASVVPVLAGTMFIVVFGVFAVGETMYAPGPHPSDRQPRPVRHGRHHAGYLRGTPDRRVRSGSHAGGVALTAGHGSLFIGVHVGISQPGGIPGTLEDLVLEAQPAQLVGVSRFVARMPARQHALVKQTS